MFPGFSPCKNVIVNVGADAGHGDGRVHHLLAALLHTQHRGRALPPLYPGAYAQIKCVN